jgi:glutathione S-transferase
MGELDSHRLKEPRMAKITLTAFPWVPPFAQGLVRDLRVRWALIEAGLPYEVRLLGPDDQTSAEYLDWQPFGQVPAYEEGGLRLFESAAIVHHIAESSEELMPADAAARARVTAWMFAAMNSVEPSIQELAVIDLFHSGEEWVHLRRPQVEESVRGRLQRLATRFDGRDYLEGRFTVADLLMCSVLRNLRHTDLVAQQPVLQAYQQRCEARPAFQQALAEQLATFAAHEPVMDGA